MCRGRPYVSISQCNPNKKLINCWISALNAKVSAIAGKGLQCKTCWRPVKTYQLLLSLSQNSKSPAKTLSTRKKKQTSHWSLIHAFFRQQINQQNLPIAKVWYSPQPSSMSKASKNVDLSPSLNKANQLLSCQMWLQEALLWVPLQCLPFEDIAWNQLIWQIHIKGKTPASYDQRLPWGSLNLHMFHCKVYIPTFDNILKSSIPNILKLSSEWSNQKIYQRNQTQEKDVNTLWLKFSPNIFQLRMKLPDFASSSWENSDNKASIKAAETSMSSVVVEQPTGRIDFQTSIDHYMKWWHVLG